MKDKKYLYVLLPLVFFCISHLLFSYGAWDINAANWSSEVRVWSALAAFIAVFAGALIASSLQNKK